MYNGDAFSICRAVRLANPKSVTVAGLFALAAQRARLPRLRLTDAGGTVADEGWYWLPPVLDKFDDPSSCFTGCKIDKFADVK